MKISGKESKAYGEVSDTQLDVLRRCKADLHRLYLPLSWHNKRAVNEGHPGIVQMVDDKVHLDNNILILQEDSTKATFHLCQTAELLFARTIYFKPGRIPYMLNVTSLLSMPDSRFDAAIDKAAEEGKDKALILYGLSDMDRLNRIRSIAETREEYVSGMIYRLLTLHNSTAVFIGDDNQRRLEGFWSGWLLNELYSDVVVYTIPSN